MCGIIGYKGFRSSKEVLLKGLERMEYRGYDSAGVAIVGKQGFKKTRAVGKLQQLKNKIKQEDYSGQLGIGHIRWATHGKVSEENAHPHQVKDICLVHNGVIENAQQLKKDLTGPFLSETDSEVVAHYLAMLREQSGSLKKAALGVMEKIKGEYAIIALSEKHPGEVIAFKKGPSLIVGLGEKEIFIASDVHAFLPYTRKAIFLKDGEVAHIQNGSSAKANGGDICFYSANEDNVKKSVRALSVSKEDLTGKGNYPHYMLKEIYEQPAGVLKLIQAHVRSDQQLVDLAIRGQEDILDRMIQSGRLSIVACGSSYYAALYGKYVIEKIARISVEVDVASEFRYRQPVLLTGVPMMVISQSGETADTLAALRMAKSLSCSILSICNVKGSAIDRQSMAQLDMLAGVEKSVASTKAFLCTLTLLFLLALVLGRKAGHLDRAKEKQWVQSLLQLPSQMEEVLSYKDLFLSVAQQLKQFSGFIYLGRGVYYPLALEGALKVKELTYRHAEGYPAGEMKHGPLALVDDQTATIVLAPPQGYLHSKILTSMEEVRARGGQLFVIGTEGDDASRSLANHFLPLPLCNKELNPILSGVSVQLIAYHLACVLGYDVDHPRNLAKSVTVE